MSSFAAQAGALRKLFGVPADAPLPAAVAMMNEQMGIVGEGPLPNQVKELVRVTGVHLGVPQQQPSPTPEVHVAVGAAVDAAPAPATSAPATAPGPSASGPSPKPAPATTKLPATLKPGGMQLDIRSMGQRQLLTKTLLTKAAASSSEVRPFHEIAKAVAVEVSVFPSEQLEKMGHAEEAAKVKVQCDMCGLLFGSTGGLVSHQRWRHSPETMPCSIFQQPPELTFDGRLSAPLAVSPHGGVR
jgi:hypothetical protein